MKVEPFGWNSNQIWSNPAHDMLVVNAAVLTIWAHGNPKNHPKIVVFNGETNGSRWFPMVPHFRHTSDSSIDQEPMKPSALLLDPSSSPTPTILQETMPGLRTPQGSLDDHRDPEIKPTWNTAWPSTKCDEMWWRINDGDRKLNYITCIIHFTTLDMKNMKRLLQDLLKSALLTSLGTYAQISSGLRILGPGKSQGPK